MQPQKVKRLFPLSFKLNNSIPALIFGILLYLVIGAVLSAVAFIVYAIVVIGALVAFGIPCLIFTVIPLVLGLVLIYVFPPIVSAVVNIVFLPFTLLVKSCKLVYTVLNLAVFVYVVSGIVLLVMSYCNALKDEYNSNREI